MLEALIQAGIVRDLSSLVHDAIRERYARHTAHPAPIAFLPAALAAPQGGAPLPVCPYTGEALVGPAAVALLPGHVIGPLVSQRLLTDPALATSPPPAAAAPESPARPAPDAPAHLDPTAGPPTEPGLV